MWTPLLVSLAAATAVADHLAGLPTVPFEACGGQLDVSTLKGIIVDSTYSDARDTDGSTLIPPTLAEFANTFAEDLAQLDIKLPVSDGEKPSKPAIFLTLGESDEYVDKAGRDTSEAYTLTVEDDGIVISGASPLGVWWGTRTVLQQLVLGDGKIPLGSGIDSPGWAQRGLMLDAARHYYPPEFVVEMCAYMSYFKQNTFQLHLSDNLYNNVEIYSYERSMDLYATFRLLSDDPAVEGLNWRRNESYTRDVFDDMQEKCAQRGVTIQPEIETPGHALVISQWKPELGLSSDLSLLNISHPDTIPTVKSIWKTFLPWFQSKIVSIGADEYVDASLSEEALIGEYKRFVDEIGSFITAESGKSVRIWGTFAPDDGADVNKSISVQHWANFEANPYWDFVKEGYEVVNSGDYIYIVAKWSEWYPQSLNTTFIFNGSPDGGPFAPNIFDRENATNNAVVDDPALLGHIAPLWNDYGPNSTTVLEAYYQWRDGLPALADKQWGGSVGEDEYPELFGALQPAVPGENLDRRIKTKTPTIVEYDFSKKHGRKGTVRDLSGNGYDAHTDCHIGHEGAILSPGCSIETPLTEKGRNYTFNFSIKPTSSDKGAIFSAGENSALWYGNGTDDAVMLVSGGNAYALNYTFPVGEWTDASLLTKGRQTFLGVGDEEPMEFLSTMGFNGKAFVWVPIAVEAPLATIGGSGFKGVIGGMKLTDDDM